MSIYSKTNVLKKLSFNFDMHMLNTVLCGRQRQTFNVYCSVNNENTFSFSTATEKLTPENGASKMIRNGYVFTEKSIFPYQSYVFKSSVLHSFPLRTNF